MLTKSNLRFYALISAIAFVAALFILFLLLWQAETLVKLGLVGKLYYLVLVPLGLCVAAFLFGTMKSVATYKGTQFGGVLELGGPVVAFILVLIFGFKLVPDHESFAVTVYVQREGQAASFHGGKVVLKLGGDRRSAAISDGAAYFSGIPATYRGRRVEALLEIPGYEATQPDITLDGEGVNLAVRAREAVFQGYVRSAAGHPLADAQVSLAGHGVKSDATGHFKLSVPGAETENGATLQVVASGYAPWSNRVEPGGNEIVAVLDKIEAGTR
ncbi:MAG: hypothetical protein KGZ83_05040 [Sulfuricella sp.]|nr:hypothetical protein [Sulfuricella sp.]